MNDDAPTARDTVWRLHTEYCRFYYMTYVILYCYIYSHIVFETKRYIMINDKLNKSIFQETHIESIDKQYESIEGIMHELSINKQVDYDINKVSQLFYKLIYINTHYFLQEQITLAKYKYSRLPVIKAIHKVFIDRVMSEREKINPMTTTFCTQMLDFLNNWFVDYKEINKGAIEFLISKNVK